MRWTTALTGAVLALVLWSAGPAGAAPASPSQLLPPATTAPAASPSATTAPATTAPAPTAPATTVPASRTEQPADPSASGAVTGWVTVGGVLAMVTLGLVVTARRRRDHGAPPPAGVPDDRRPSVGAAPADRPGAPDQGGDGDDGGDVRRRSLPAPGPVVRAADRAEPGAVLTRQPTVDRAAPTVRGPRPEPAPRIREAVEAVEAGTAPARAALPPPGPVAHPARPTTTSASPPAPPPAPPSTVAPRAVVRAAPKQARPLSKRKGRR